MDDVPWFWRWLWRWRYVYARPVWHRRDAERLRRLGETHGEDSRAAGNAISEGLVWLPWWRSRRRGQPIWKRVD